MPSPAATTIIDFCNNIKDCEIALSALFLVFDLGVSAIDAPSRGGRVPFGNIDAGGHRRPEIERFSDTKPKCF